MHYGTKHIYSLCKFFKFKVLHQNGCYEQGTIERRYAKGIFFFFFFVILLEEFTKRSKTGVCFFLEMCLRSRSGEGNDEQICADTNAVFVLIMSVNTGIYKHQHTG